MPRLLVARFLRALIFLLSFCSLQHCTVYCCRFYDGNIPGWSGFCCFRLLLCCSLACENFCFVLFFLLCLVFFFFFCCCLLLFFCCFPVILVFDYFFNDCEFVCFSFSLVVSCALFVCPVCTCTWLAWNTLCAPENPLNALWCSCGHRIPHCHASPPHVLATIMSCSAINHSFWLVLHLLCDDAPPCTHPNPSSLSWVPCAPFCLYTHACVFSGKFPGHTCDTNMPCQPIFASACLVFVSPRAPIP